MTKKDDFIWDLMDFPLGKIADDWYDAGIRLVIARGPASWCLYFGIPSGHPLAGFSCDDIPVDCHGGLTFAREGDGVTWPKGFYWYGCDYSHFMDCVSYRHEEPTSRALGCSGNAKHWTIEDVKKDSVGGAYDLRRLMGLAEAIASKAFAAGRK